MNGCHDACFCRARQDVAILTSWICTPSTPSWPQTVCIVPKAGVWHQRAIHQLLRLVTLGAQSSLPRSLRDHASGTPIYVTADWEARPLAERYATLRHELVHVRQFERWGCAHGGRLSAAAAAARAGLVPHAPRARGLRGDAAGVAPARRARRRASGCAPTSIAQFTSGAYGWMWPFPRAVGRWFDRFVASL